MTKERKQEVKASVIGFALNVLYDETLTEAEKDEARKQIARIEKMFGFEPFSFTN